MRVGSDCGTEAQDLGAGRQWLDFPVAGETVQKGCQILFQPAAGCSKIGNVYDMKIDFFDLAYFLYRLCSIKCIGCSQYGMLLL